MVYILILAILDVTIFIHEMGHLLAARYYNVPASVFSIGIGPRLWGFSWKGTDMRLSLIPIGGYVRFEDDEEENDEEDERIPLPAGYSVSVTSGSPLDRYPIYTRLVILFAGPLVNLLAGALVYNAHLIATYGLSWFSLLEPYRLAITIPFIAIGSLLDPRNFSGPIGIFHDGGGIIAEGGVVMFWVLLQYSIAATNLLPISFLDGGQIARTLINRWKVRWGDYWLLGTTVILLIVFFGGFGNDIFNLFAK